jgi:hypothetical protein
VRVDATRLQTCAIGELAEDEERAGACERTPAGVEEELGPIPPIEVGAAEREVAPHGFGGWTAERDETFLAAFPEHAHDTFLDGDAAPLEARRLGDAQSGAVQELHEGTVAQRPRGRSDRSVDEALGLGGRERAG